MKKKNEATAKATKHQARGLPKSKHGSGNDFPVIDHKTARFQHREQVVSQAMAELLSGKKIATALGGALHRVRAAITHQPNGSMRVAKS